MPVDAIGAGIGDMNPLTPSAASQMGGLDSEAFLKLLVAQLRYQNPMAPTDASAMLQQTAQFTQVETLQQVAAAQQQLLSYHQASVASAMVGKEVTIADQDGSLVVGVVEAMRFTKDGPLLVVDGKELPLDRVIEAREPGSSLLGTTAPEGAEEAPDPLDADQELSA